MIDKEAILLDTDCRQLVKWLGLDVVRMGATEYIPCLSQPHHSTEGRNSKGKARYTHNMVTKDGCYCFTCHEHLDAISIVQKYHECYGGEASFVAACREISEFLGNPAKYMDSNIKRKSFPYTNEELYEMGFSQDSRRILQTLFYEEPKVFEWIVRSVQEETEKKLLHLRTQLVNQVFIKLIDERVALIEREKGRSYI